jgi:hypothetical protein
MAESLLPKLAPHELGKLAGDFDEMARVYWEKSWGLGEPRDVVSWCQRQAAAFYSEGRRVRSHAIAHAAASRVA